MLDLSPILSVIVPVKNEESAVGDFVAKVSATIEALQDPASQSYEILFIDDGSTDGTLSAINAARAANARVWAVSLSRNFGKEAALSAGLDYARGDAIVPMDVDLQDPPEVLHEMVARWRSGFDAVYGVRANRATDSAPKRFFADMYYKVHNVLSGDKIPPHAGDFRLLDRRVVDVIRKLPERTRFMKGIFAWIGFRQTSVEYDRACRQQGTSKFNGWRLWSLALDGITSSSTLPLRIWTYIGASLAVLSFLYAIFIVGKKVVVGDPVAGYASLMAAVLFFGGVQLLSIGILGEYVGRIMVEAKQRPLYVVRGILGAAEREAESALRLDASSVGWVPEFPPPPQPAVKDGSGGIHLRSHESLSASARGALPFKVALWMVSLLVSWWSLTLIYATSWEPTWDMLCNSDLLMPFMLMRDAMKAPSSLLDWSLSPAPYVFPDWIIASLMQWLPLPPAVRPLAYGGLLLAAFGLIIGWMLVELRLARPAPAAVLGTLAIAGLFLASNASRVALGGVFLKYCCAPYVHSGALFSGLLLIPLLTRVFHEDADESRWAAVVTFIIVPIAVLSDLIFVAQFLLPVSLSFLLMPARMSRPRRAAFIGSLLAVSAVVWGVDRMFRPSSRPVTGPWASCVKSVTVLAEFIAAEYANAQWQLVLPLALTVVMMGRGVVLLFTHRDHSRARQDACEAAIIAANTASICVPLVLGLVVDRGQFRYSLPVVFLPYVWVLLFVARAVGPLSRWWLPGAATCAVVGAIVLAPLGASSIDKIEGQKTLTDKLLSLGLSAGYGDYWTCKRTMFESEYAVHCIQIDANCQPLGLNYNRTWFARRADDGGALRPTFVVLTGLNVDKVRAAFGEPDSVHKVLFHTIWVYEEPLPLLSPSQAVAIR